MLTENSSRNVGFLVFDGVYFTDVVVTRVVFDEANYVLKSKGKKPAYRIFSVGEKEEVSVYQSMKEKCFLLDSEEAGNLDVLIIPGGKMDQVTESEAISEYIAGQFSRLAILASVCGGAVALAHFGYLKGKFAATHPIGRYEEIESKYPDQKIRLVRRPVVQDGKIMTSGGVFKGVDLGLRIVRDDLGDLIASLVVQEIRYFGEGKF